MTKGSTLEGVKKKTTTNDGTTEYTIDGMGVYGAGPSWKTKIDLSKHESMGTGHSKLSTQIYDVNLSKIEMLLPRIRAFIKTSIHTTYFTEYVLPFLIFLIPVIYKLKSVI